MKDAPQPTQGLLIPAALHPNIQDQPYGPRNLNKLHSDSQKYIPRIYVFLLTHVQSLVDLCEREPDNLL